MIDIYIYIYIKFIKENIRKERERERETGGKREGNLRRKNGRKRADVTLRIARAAP